MLRISKLNLKIIIKIFGFLMIVEGLFMLPALPFSYYYHQDDGLAILISAIITMGLGTILWFSCRKCKAQLGKREGFVVVAAAWMIISLFGALPFYIHGSIPKYIDAFFETISGFTTTGASILTDIETMPKGLLFWRSMTHWIGGMGIIVLTVAILPVFGFGGMQLYAAEMPGPTKDKIHPRIKETAKRLWGIYILFTLFETLLLLWGNMSLFDALCHSFGTMATGGFSTRNQSIAAFSPYVQYVILFFMILAGTNFSLHYFLLKGKFNKIIGNEEFRFYLLLILITSFIIAPTLIIFSNFQVEEAIRHSFFQVVAIITTTGYVTSDYLLWPNYLWFLIFLLMFVGGSAGSTGGGIKVLRQLLLLKNSSLELRRIIHPAAIVLVRLNKKAIPSSIIYNVQAFFLLYILIFACGSLVMSILGYDFETAVSAVATTLGNVGPGLGSVGPTSNFAHLSDFAKVFLSFLMLLGRLELFTVLILFSRAFWRE